MQTMKSSGPVPRAGNIVELNQLRRQALARRDSPSPVPEEGPALRVISLTPEERRRARRERRAWRLDACASLAMILMTAIFALRVLL